MSLDDLKYLIKGTPISSILENYLPLVRKGTTILAICPFHSDTNPSLNINDRLGFYKCFACGASGDSISFVQNKFNLEFIAALEEISKMLGIDFESFVSRQKKDPRHELGLKILNAVSKIYLRIGQEDRGVFKKFLNDRGLTREIATQFHLGLAPSNNVIYEYLSTLSPTKDKSKALKMSLELSLTRPDQFRPGSHYDTFRERIIFPIWDHFGHIVGLTSRQSKEGQKPKYLNSKESFLFNKKTSFTACTLQRVISDLSKSLYSVKAIWTLLQCINLDLKIQSLSWVPP